MCAGTGSYRLDTICKADSKLCAEYPSGEFCKSGETEGQSEWSILMHHVFPNAIRPVVVTGTLHLSGAMLSISGLSFLGLGSSSAEWGSMLSEGRSLMQQCPWMVLYPALAIFFVTILFNLLGDSVRDALDPQETMKL